MASAVVKLNVGGVKYQTSLSTLTLVEPESMLARMVQQDREAHMIKNGEEIFIDRDGELFKYILDHLRNPTSASRWCSKDPILAERLKIEADFFGVLGLQKKIEEDLLHPFAPGDLVQYKPEVVEAMLNYCKENRNAYGYSEGHKDERNRSTFMIEARDLVYFGFMAKDLLRPYPMTNLLRVPVDLMCLTGRVVERVEGKPGCVVHFHSASSYGTWTDQKFEIHNSLLCRA